MDYKEALKAVQTKKMKENYFLISISYDTKMILPYKAGLSFLESLNYAEQLNDPYGKPHRITELEKNKIQITTMSAEEYERYKIAALLGITPDEVADAARGITNE